MAKKWYVLHTYSGYEKKVKANLDHRRESMGMEDKIFEILVPTTLEEKLVNGKRRVTETNTYPGYVFVQMELDDLSWSVARNTPGVTGFVGADGKPAPLSRKEYADILRRTEPDAPRRTTTDLEVGQVVKIITGPLADFDGQISEVNVDSGKVKVMVSIFGRETSVEMDFNQVSKVV